MIQLNLMNGMVIGLTATRYSLTSLQKKTFEELIGSLQFTGAVHGDCVGGDSILHDITREVKPQVFITIYPSTFDKMRAFKHGNLIMPPMPALERDKLIVDESDLIVGCPFTNQEVRRSGTWYTLRYAVKVNKPIKIIAPDGKIREKI